MAQAKIEVVVTGAEEAAAKVDKLKAQFKRLGIDVDATFKGVARSFTAPIGQMASEIVGLGKAAGSINLGQGVAQFKAYNESITRLAVSSGQTTTALRTKFAELAKAKLVPEQSVAAFTKAMKSVTYDGAGAANAFSGLADEAMATGKSADEMVPLGATLHNMLGVTGDTTQALGRMRTQAELLGTVGGPGALHDQLVGISGILGSISDQTPNAAGKMTALLAGFGGGKGKVGENASSLQTVIGAVEGNGFGYIRTLLGKGYGDYIDDSGHVKDPIKLLKDVKAAIVRKSSSRKDAQNRMREEYGMVAGSALFNTDFDKIEKAASVAPSAAASVAQGNYAKSLAGQVAGAEQSKSRAEMAQGEQLLPTMSRIEALAGEWPKLTTLTSGVLANLASVAGGVGGGAFNAGVDKIVAATLAKSVGGAGGGGGAMGALGKAGAVLAAGAAGYAVGTAADEALGISDWISGTGDSSRIKSDDEVEFQKDEERRRARKKAQLLVDARAPGVDAGAVAVSSPAGSAPQQSAAEAIARLNATILMAIAKQTNPTVTIVNNSGVDVAVDESKSGAPAQ